MTQITTPSQARLPVPQLVRQSGAEAELRPDGNWRAALKTEMELIDLRKLRMEVHISPVPGGFTLTGHLGATVIQPCVVTLEPVTTRIEAPLVRSFLENLPEPDADDMEMPEDDSLEPLGAVIDLGDVMAEALALNLPDYPRADGAALDASALDADEGPDEAPPEQKPFSGLQDLRNKLSGKTEEPE